MKKLNTERIRKVLEGLRSEDKEKIRKAKDDFYGQLDTLKSINFLFSSNKISDTDRESILKLSIDAFEKRIKKEKGKKEEEGLNEEDDVGESSKGVFTPERPDGYMFIIVRNSISAWLKESAKGTFKYKKKKENKDKEEIKRVVIISVPPIELIDGNNPSLNINQFQSSSNSDDELMYDDLVSTCKLILTKWDDVYLETFEAYFVKSKSYKEISEMLALKEPTIRQRISRIRKILKEELGGNWD